MRSMIERWSEPALALALVLCAEVELAAYGLLRTPLQALLALLVAAPVALRFRAPLLALTLTGLAGAAQEARVDDTGQILVPVVCVLLALYAVGSRQAGWRLPAAAIIAAASVGGAMLIRGDDTSDLAFGPLVSVVGLLIGRASGVLMLETEVLSERATALERDRDEHTRLALEDERSRIARELHDVIGHSISVMGLQAGAVRSVLPPERAVEREALLAVERTGRDAVAEMRRLIGLLRTDMADDGPRPSLARVEPLAAELRGAGQRLALTVEGDVGHLPPGVDLAGYRIVQEALTNALKHAPGAQVTATVRLAGRVLDVEVVDDGASAPASRNGHIGHGLIGMRERAVLYGGEVSAAARPEGGFRVHARLPVAGG